MNFRIIHFYPDLMSLYGSYANLSVLTRYLETLGHSVTVEQVNPGDEADLTDADFLFLGAGTERTARFCMGDLTRFAEALKAAADCGTAMLFCGTAMELLGTTITAADGTSFPGLGLAPFTTVQGSRRIVGDVIGSTDLYEDAVVGFMNKCSTSAGIETPLLTSCAMGFGNDAQGGPEGYHAGSVFASALTGPILVKNPRLLDLVAEKILSRRGEMLPQKRPSFPYLEDGYAITARELNARCAQGK